MFPLNNNDEYIQSNGKRSKLGSIINSGGGADIPDYSESDAGKVLTVNDAGELEWDEPEGGVVVLYGSSDPSTATGENGNLYFKTGLSFSADPDYIVDSTEQRLSTQTFAFYKTTNDRCIAVHYKTGQYYGPLLIGMSADSVKYTGNTTPAGSFVIDGITWYVGSYQDWSTSQDDPTIPTMYDDTLELNDTNLPAIIQRILTEADVTVNDTAIVKTFAKINNSWFDVIGQDINDVITI